MKQTSDLRPFPKGISQPAIRALLGAGYSRLDQAAGASEAKLLELHGFGPKAIRILRQALMDEGLAPLEPAPIEPPGGNHDGAASRSRKA